MRVIIRNTDITEHISESSYIMNSVEKITEWEDGNDVTHQLVTSEKVSGSFSVALYGKNGMDATAFIQLVNSAKRANGAVYLLVYISNKAISKYIEARLTIASTMHRKLDNGNYLDVFNVEVQEL